MKRYALFTVLLVALGVFLVLYFSRPIERKIKIGVILPVRHRAIEKIFQGFEKTLLESEFKNKIQIIKKNAEGDKNVQRSIIHNFVSDGVDVFVPVSTELSKITLGIVKTKPVISLATTEDVVREASAGSCCGLSAVFDEVSVEKIFNLAIFAMPSLRKAAIVYSADEKMVRQVEELERLAKSNGVRLQKSIVFSPGEIPLVSKSLDSDVQAIFVLKDNFVSSNIEFLISQANLRKIPIFSSDQESVLLGACCAIGVLEEEIGSSGAKIVEKFLSGKKPYELGFIDLKSENLNLFINSPACKAQPAFIKNLENYAIKFNLKVVNLD